MLALCASAVPGRQKVTLCFSTDSHLDLRQATRACPPCPGADCVAHEEPEEAPASRPPAGDACCSDIPVLADLVGWLQPRVTDRDRQLTVAKSVEIGPATASDPLGGPRSGPRLAAGSPPLRSLLDALGTVVLRL